LLATGATGAGSVLVWPGSAATADWAEALVGAGLSVAAGSDPDAARGRRSAADLFLVEGDGPQTEDRLRALAADRLLAHVPVMVLGSRRLTWVGVRRLFGLGATAVLLPPHHSVLVVGKAQALVRLKRQVDLARELSVRDELTGLYNRRFFFERLDQEVARARRSNQGVALLLLDVDEFKRVNDTWGHPVGDEVLRAIAQVTLRHTRRSDLAARVGGDEFAILLSANTLAGAKACARGLQRRLREARLGPPGDRQPTVSVGIAAWPDPLVQNPLVDLLRVADQALLRAKAAGKNRIEAAGEGPVARLQAVDRP
jgi:diguanylate cyclase (GGDEF)-like protein